MLINAVIAAGRAMSFRWIFAQHVDVRKLRILSAQPKGKKTGLFWTEDLNTHLNEACEEWKDLLCAIVNVNVEPSRVDLSNALDRSWLIFSVLHFCTYVWAVFLKLIYSLLAA